MTSGGVRFSRSGAGIKQIFSSVSGGAVKLCVSLQVPQTIPMDLRIGQRLAKPSPDTALLALKQTQQLQHQFFLASLHQQQVEQLTRPHLRVSVAIVLFRVSLGNKRGEVQI